MVSFAYLKKGRSNFILVKLILCPCTQCFNLDCIFQEVSGHHQLSDTSEDLLLQVLIKFIKTFVPNYIFSTVSNKIQSQMYLYT